MAHDTLGQARAILETLVGFDTTSHRSNLALIEWVEAYLAQRGVPCVRAPNAEGDKSNLIAVVGPWSDGGVVLSGHTDVVPVDGQPWSSDPWTVREADGRLYGRGVADMKSFLALSLAQVDAALAAPLARPLILAFSYDEEVGCLGAPGLIAALPNAAPVPSCVIVGEPTLMRCLSGHKSISTFTVELTGLEAHSSQTHRGASAIMAAVPILQTITDLAEEAKAKADPESPFTPPYSTLTVGRIEGGTAVNILARRCWFQWDLRCAPQDDPRIYHQRVEAAVAQADAALKRVSPDAGAVMTQRSGTPGMAPQPDSIAEQLVRSLTGDNGFEVAAFAAEGGLFQRAGYPVVVCGPGSIDQAHQPDEWIAVDQLAAGDAFLRRLVDRLKV